MSSSFQIVAISREYFEHLFSMSDAELSEHDARRMIVDSNPGFPCRVSLTDAEVGETVILASFAHHDVHSPYQSTGPIFVREAAQTARLEVNEIPLMLRHRLLSVRAYNEKAMMKSARVVEGRTLEETIRHFFSDSKVAYLHLHNAAPGCFNCLVQRAD